MTQLSKGSFFVRHYNEDQCTHFCQLSRSGFCWSRSSVLSPNGWIFWGSFAHRFRCRWHWWEDSTEGAPLQLWFIHSFIHSFIQNIWKCVFLVTGLINPSNREIVSNCCEKDHLSSSKCCFLMSFVPKYPFVFHHQTAPLTDKMDRPSHPVQVPKSLTWSEASIMRSWLHRARDSLQARHRVEWLQDIGNVWEMCHLLVWWGWCFILKSRVNSDGGVMMVWFVRKCKHSEWYISVISTFRWVVSCLIGTCMIIYMCV